MSDYLNHCPRKGSWQRRQRELRDETLKPNVARDPATRKTQRDAFLQGCKHIRQVYFLAQNAEQAGADYNEALYRFPKELTVTRPRTLRIAHGPDVPGYDVAWRYVDGKFLSQDVRVGGMLADHLWVERHQLPAAWIDQLLELKRNPTETVPA